MTEINAKKMKVVELREALAERGLDVSGLKAELVERLEAAIAAPAPEEEEASAEVEEAVTEAATAENTTEAAPEAAPEATTDAADATEPVEKTEEPAAEPVAEPVAEVATAPAAVKELDAFEIEIEKRKKRAEKFGVPFEMTAEDKKKLRAKRFGVPASSPITSVKKQKVGGGKSNIASKTTKIADEEMAKRLKRAKRFGLALPTETPTAPATKSPATKTPATKTPATKTPATATPAVNEAELAKRKAREARFAVTE